MQELHYKTKTKSYTIAVHVNLQVSTNAPLHVYGVLDKSFDMTKAFSFLQEITKVKTLAYNTSHLLIGWHVHVWLRYSSGCHLLSKHLLHPVWRWYKWRHNIAMTLGWKVITSVGHLLATTKDNTHVHVQ